MKTSLPLTLLIGLLSLNALAQVEEIKPEPDLSQCIGSATKSPEFILQCQGFINTPSADLHWKPTLINRRLRKEHNGPDQKIIEEIKREKLKEKMQHETAEINSQELFSTTTLPIVGTNFPGNGNNGVSPMDNSIAISNGGWIVSVANTTIEYDDMNGNTLYYNDILSFLNDNSIATVCDPLVLYDPQADRFIFVAKECGGYSGTSYVLICFSKSNNPMNGWWYYKLPGNPMNDGSWFDYPKIGVSAKELYITGNLFYNNNYYNQSIMYQIEKAYNGGNLTWQYWHNIPGNPYTITPLSYGHNGSYGPGCYFVASYSGGGASVQFYNLTNYMSASNEQMLYYSVSTTPYSPSADARQSGTSVLLDNGDCRMLSGFYLNGYAHFVFHSGYLGGSYNGINYNRLNVATRTNKSVSFGSSGYDCSFPSVVSFAKDSTDKSVMIGFLRSGSSIYPEMRVINCDDQMQWSASTLVKAGATYVNQYQYYGLTRWGDYTGTARKHNNPFVSIWMSGMYGASGNKLSSWIAEIHAMTVGVPEKPANPPLHVFPNPVTETFSLEFSLPNTSEVEINITDIGGRTIQQLYKGNALAGSNVFSFNRANLVSGVYFLSLKVNAKTLRNEKIVIAR